MPLALPVYSPRDTTNISLRLLVVEPDIMRRKCAQQQLQRFARPELLRKLHFASNLADAWHEINHMDCQYDCIAFGDLFWLAGFDDPNLHTAIFRQDMGFVESLALIATEKNENVVCMLCIHDNAAAVPSTTDSRIRSIKASEHTYAGSWDPDKEILSRGTPATQPILDYLKALRSCGFLNNSRLAYE